MPRKLPQSASITNSRSLARNTESTIISNSTPAKKRKTIFEPEVIIDTNLAKKTRKSTRKEETKKNKNENMHSVKKRKSLTVKNNSSVKKTKSSANSVKKTKSSVKKTKSSANSVKKTKSSVNSVKKTKSSGDSVKKTKKCLIKDKKKRKSNDEIPEEDSAYLKIQQLTDGSFLCMICKCTFTHRYKAKNHIKIRHEITWYSCDYCGKKYKTKFQVLLHINIHHREHPSDYKFCCDKCGYQAKSKYYLKTHIVRKHTTEYNYECDICKKRFKIKMDLKFHISTHDEANHMCDLCGKMYTSEISLNKHRRVFHFNVDRVKFRCEVCNQKLMTQESLDNHMRMHINVPTCDECGQTFTKRHYVNRHKKRIHKVIKPHSCKLCGKLFACMSTLRIHYLSHTKSKPYLCNVCGFTFTQRSSMMLHWKKKHPDAEAPPPPVVLTNFFDTLDAEIDRLAAAKAAAQESNNTNSNNANVDIEQVLPTFEY